MPIKPGFFLALENLYPFSSKRKHLLRRRFQNQFVHRPKDNLLDFRKSKQYRTSRKNILGDFCKAAKTQRRSRKIQRVLEDGSGRLFLGGVCIRFYYILLKTIIHFQSNLRLNFYNLNFQFHFHHFQFV